MAHFDANRNMEHLEQQIQQLMLSMQQRDEQLINLQAQINHNEEIHAGALAAAQEAANNALQALHANANNVNNFNDNLASQHKELERIFNFIPTFNGNSLKVFSFIKSVENILPQIENFDHNLVVEAIKSKIEVDVLEASPSETWNEIKQSLVLHFGDKRDEAALVRDLHNLPFSESAEEYYEKIEKMLVLLTNRAKLLEPNETLPTKINLYKNMALKVFVGSLRGQPGTFVRSRNPESLNEALILYNEEKSCIEGHSSRNLTPTVPSKPKLTQHPSQLQITNQRQLPMQQQFPFYQQFPIQQQYPFPSPFPTQQRYPNLQQFPAQYPYNAQPVQRINNYPNNGQQRMILPKPTPMEVDSSIRSKNINYMNRVNRNPELKNFKIEELRNINTNEVEAEAFPPEQVEGYYNDTNEDEVENKNLNFLTASEENPET